MIQVLVLLVAKTAPAFDGQGTAPTVIVSGAAETRTVTGQPSEIPVAATPTDHGASLIPSPTAIHRRLEQSILKEALLLDNFFGRSDPDSQRKTQYLLRWRNSLRVGQNGDLQLGSTVHMDLELSRISNRLHFSLAGENEPDPLAPRLPQDPGNPGFDRTFPRSTHVVNTELHYDVIRSPMTDAFLGSGVRLSLPPEAFIRGRFQHIHSINDLSLVRFAETLFLKTPYGLGETTEFSMERTLNQNAVLRWSNSGTASQEIRGLEWGAELSVVQALDQSSNVIVTGGMYGNTSLDDWVRSYRIGTRYRRNFWADWLYYELEPEISWTRRDDGIFAAISAVNFRLEVVFQGKEQNKASR